ncbi:MAG TPA: N-acetylglucosamine-6-phosphate deacetylase [Chitinophaga sp.]
MQLKIINARVLTPSRLITPGAVLVQEGRIAGVELGRPEVAADQVIDAAGRYVAPGFIDIHVHGGGGYDFMDNSVQAFLEIARLHARYGTTALAPTTLSCEQEDLYDTLDAYKAAHALNRQGAAFIGMHIEGPYFAMEQRGAQDPRYIRAPRPAEYEAITAQYDFIKRWSAAPELPGAMAFGRYMKSRNILPAIAHTNAIDQEVFEAFANGFTHATHFYSCMSTVSRRNAFRYAGVVEAAYLLDDMTVELIADGRHLPASLLQLVYKIKGPDKIALITDAMRGAGMPPGASILGGARNGQPVIIEDGVAKLPDRSAFAGSVATADLLVRNMVQMAGIPLPEAVQMMTATPARIMGIAAQKGALLPGMDADLVLFDDDIRVSHTIIGGHTVFTADL